MRTLGKRQGVAHSKRRRQLLTKEWRTAHALSSPHPHSSKQREPKAVSNKQRKLVERWGAWLSTSTSLSVKVGAIHNLRVWLERTDHPIQPVLDCGAVPTIARVVSALHPHTALLWEAACTLKYIASGSTEHTRAVVDAGIVPHTVRILASSPHLAIRVQGLGLMINVAGDSAKFRDLTLECNPIPPLVAALATAPSPTTARDTVWAIGNLLRHQPPVERQVGDGAVRPLVVALHSADAQVVYHACKGLMAFAGGTDGHKAAVAEANALVRLVELLGHPQHGVVSLALQTIGTISSGSDEDTQTLLDAGALRPIRRILEGASYELQKHACWVLSNVAGGTFAQIQVLIDQGMIPPVLRLLAHGGPTTRDHAAWVVSNASCGREEHVKHLVEQGCLPLLCDAFPHLALQTQAAVARCFLRVLGSVCMGEFSADGERLPRLKLRALFSRMRDEDAHDGGALMRALNALGA